MRNKLSNLNSNTTNCKKAAMKNPVKVATGNLLKSKKSDDHTLECKLSSYNGSEKLRVWLNRFESVPKLPNWTSKEKLQELLPKIQGNAVYFVFGQ